MGFKKILSLPLILLTMSGCVLLSRKAAVSSQSAFPPKPEIITEKILVILPFENFSGKMEYDFAAQMIPGELYRFLRFANSYPFSLESARLSNEEAFFDYFGVKNPDSRQRKLYLSEAQKMLAFEEPSDPEKKFKGLPDFFSLKVLPPQEAVTAEILKERPLFLRGRITENKSIILEIEDSFTGEIVLSWPVPIPPLNLDWSQGEMDLQKTLYPFLQPFLEKLSGKKFYAVTVQPSPSDLTLYLNSLFVSQKEVYLPEGEHGFKAVKPGFFPKEGKIKVLETSAFEITLTEQKASIEVLIQTDPPESPLFIDEKYYGLSPVKAELSPGFHQVRISRNGYQHSNTPLKLFSFDAKKEIMIVLEPEKKDQESTRKTINFVKNFSFYSFFPFFGAFIYCQEKYDYYAEKRQMIYQQYASSASAYGYNDLMEKEQFYNTSRQFFRNSSIFLLMTAAVLQILELEMDDVGVGVDQDKNLGIYWKW